MRKLKLQIKFRGNFYRLKREKLQNNFIHINNSWYSLGNFILKVKDTNQFVSVLLFEFVFYL